MRHAIIVLCLIVAGVAFAAPAAIVNAEKFPSYKCAPLDDKMDARIMGVYRKYQATSDAANQDMGRAQIKKDDAALRKAAARFRDARKILGELPRIDLTKSIDVGQVGFISATGALVQSDTDTWKSGEHYIRYSPSDPVPNPELGIERKMPGGLSRIIRVERDSKVSNGEVDIWVVERLSTARYQAPKKSVPGGPPKRRIPNDPRKR